jgi:hypothetical protein
MRNCVSQRGLNEGVRKRAACRLPGDGGRMDLADINASPTVGRGRLVDGGRTCDCWRCPQILLRRWQQGLADISIKGRSRLLTHVRHQPASHIAARGY